MLLYRELIISTLRTLCGLKGFALAARKSGKIKALMQGFFGIFIVVSIILHQNGILSLFFIKKFSFYLVFIVSVYSIATAIDYIYANKKYLKKLID